MGGRSSKVPPAKMDQYQRETFFSRGDINDLYDRYLELVCPSTEEREQLLRRQEERRQKEEEARAKALESEGHVQESEEVMILAEGGGNNRGGGGAALLPGDDFLLTKDQFLTMPEYCNNPLAGRLFEVFSEGEETMDVDTFFHLASAMSPAASMEVKTAVAFRVFDFDNDGFVTENDVLTMLETITGRDGLDANEGIGAGLLASPQKSSPAGGEKNKEGGFDGDEKKGNREKSAATTDKSAVGSGNEDGVVAVENVDDDDGAAEEQQAAKPVMNDMVDEDQKKGRGVDGSASADPKKKQSTEGNTDVKPKNDSEGNDGGKVDQGSKADDGNDNGEAPAPTQVHDLSDDELRDLAHQVFRVCDLDGNGELSEGEFSRILYRMPDFVLKFTVDMV